VRVWEAADPVAAFLTAHDRGQRVALLTSGTSGRGRCVVVRTTQSWVLSFEHVSRLTGLDATCRVWVPGPLTSTMNLFAAVHARWAGARLVEQPSDATHAQLTPTALERVLDGSVDVDAMHVVVAGDRLPRSLLARARARVATVSHYYGATELSFVAWAVEVGGLRAFPGVDLDVQDGVVWARSAYLCEGYAEPGTPDRTRPDRTRPDRTRPDRNGGPLRRRADGFATVGDRGALVDGTLHVFGRGDDWVTTAGVTVCLADVEHALGEDAGGDVVVVGLPHATLGEVVAAVLTDDADLRPLRRVARTSLSPGQRPRVWFHCPRLPLTSAGKVDRAALRAMLVSPGESVRRLT
jgi:long-chain acyl-CoA synthetase